MTQLRPAATRAPLSSDVHPVPSPDRVFARGVSVAVGLLALSVLVAHLPGVDVHAGIAAPLYAAWGPRVGVGTVPALALVWWSTTSSPWVAARTMGWGRLLMSVWALSLVWMASLALVDGVGGVAGVLTHDTEYLITARGVGDVGELMHSFVGRIPLSAHDTWPVHVAGHPPGALLLFVGLVRLGLGSGLAAGLVVCAVAATTPVAAAVTCRALGLEARVRSVLPFLVLGPFALWQAVSADAVFAAVAAWTIAVAALAGASRRRPTSCGLAVVTGVALGSCALLSYGLPLVGMVVVAALAGTRGWTGGLARLVGAVAAGAIAVVGGCAVAGFEYWDAYLVVHQRYWDGLASARPAAYWLWANVALLAVSAGPVLFGALAATGGRVLISVQRPQEDPVLALVAGAVLAVAVADLSLMSKAEVERIWLPFVPWLLLSAVAVPGRWRQRALVVQAGLGLLVQSLLVTPW